MPTTVNIQKPIAQGISSPILVPKLTGPKHHSWFLIIYAGTIFLSAFLLFEIELIMGKFVLPRFGGTPSVWSTSLLVFQVLLFAGYAYAALISIKLKSKYQAISHIAFLLGSALLMMLLTVFWHSPILPSGSWAQPDTQAPIRQIALLLISTVGIPCVLLSATSPLLQHWLSHSQTRSPYRLYALSNLGSMIGLIAYPLLVERMLRLSVQAWTWTIGYAVFLVLACASALFFMSTRTQTKEQNRKPAKIKQSRESQPKILWLMLAACSSTMLMATTNLLSQQVAPVPLLWVLPLSIYLASFIICFDHSRWYKRGIFHPLYLGSALLSLKMLPSYSDISTTRLVVIFCAALLAVCMVCHGELARLKPAPQYLTSFYLMISAGGAIGSAAVVLIAPQIFDRVWEFQIALLGCGIILAVTILRERTSWVYSIRYGGAILAMASVVLLGSAYFYTDKLLEWEGSGNIVAIRTRNFFGVKTVLREQDNLVLVHGHTLHGMQHLDAKIRNEPTIYFGRQTGVGLLLDHYPRLAGQENLRVGVIGMGVGTLAAYARPGDYFRFYEIDPAILDLSLGTRPVFTFMQSSASASDVVLGDARVTMQREIAKGELQNFNVLVVDAFNGDSIPVHLLTHEAMEIYLRQLRNSHSVIAFHISNHALDLRPVVAKLAQSFHLASVEVDTPAGLQPIWILLSQDPQALRMPGLNDVAHPVEITRAVKPWTDDYSNVYQLLHW